MAKRQWRRLTPELRGKIVGLAARGATTREILDQVDTSSGAITIVLRDWGGVTRSDTVWEPSPLRLSLDERVAIKTGLELGRSLSAIARGLGRAASTVCREVNNNGGRDLYWPTPAHARAARCARRPKPTRLATNTELCGRVIADLHKLWSPRGDPRKAAVRVSRPPGDVGVPRDHLQVDLHPGPR